MLMIAKLDQISAFLSDQWSLNNRLTLSLGVRYDHYKSHIPEQKQLASTVGPFSVPAQTFDPKTFEVSMNKRISKRWSANAGFGYTWSHDSPNRNNPNVRGAESYTRWSLRQSSMIVASSA